MERGQPEVYVVLEEAQIGVRIRESYSVDIDRMPMYQESMGILDIALSVPPQYGVVNILFLESLSYPTYLKLPLITHSPMPKQTTFSVSRQYIGVG